jgi:hypothetical protein
MCLLLPAQSTESTTTVDNIPPRTHRRHRKRRNSKRDSHHHPLVTMSSTSLSKEDPVNTERPDVVSSLITLKDKHQPTPQLDTGDHHGSSTDVTDASDPNPDLPSDTESKSPPRIPTPPPLPPPSAFHKRKLTSSSGKTPITNGSSSDSEGRHTCSNGKIYPPLDELLKFGRVNRSQLIQVEQHFNSERYHCITHMLCEGIYKISDVSESDNLVIEDFIPLARNDFSTGLQNVIETHLRSRHSIKSDKTDNATPSRTRAKRENSLQLRKFDSQPSTTASEKSEESHDYTVILSEQFPPPRISSGEVRFSDELTSPVRQRILRDQMQVDDSEPETIKPKRHSSPKSFKPFMDLEKDMAQAIELCSLPQIFHNLRLTFLHYIHQSLYSLHLRTHVKTQSYPKTDILELLILGRDLCDQRSKYRNDIRHPQLLKLFLRETFSRRSRKIKSNCFQVPMLQEGHSLTSSLALEALTSFHQQYQVEWNQQFGQMITPSFI